MVAFVVVGWGYRSRAWWEAARGIGAECVGVVVRSPRETPVPAFGSLSEAIAATGARLAVASVSWDATPAIAREAADAGIGIVVETPPAPDSDGLEALWRHVGATGLVQVAEQYPRYPSHAARLALTASGVIGTPTQVQVSSTQTYHALSLMRAHLGWPDGATRVTATSVTAPVLQPLSRAGWTGATEPEAATTTHAVLDFGDGRSGVYDFTDNLTRNLLRFRRLTVRGTLGELDADTVVRWGGPETILTSRIERRQSGYDLDMSGYDTETLSHDGRVLWRNPWPGLHWPDDTLATATLLRDALAWAADEGPEPYPLERALTDARLGFAIQAAVEAGGTLTVPAPPWVA